MGLNAEPEPDTTNPFKQLHIRLEAFPAPSPLHQAVAASKPSLCARLLAAGANPNARDDNGETPLHYLCKTPGCFTQDGWSDQTIAELLLKAGAEANARATDIAACPPVTPLFWAAFRHKRSLLKLLITLGGVDASDTLSFLGWPLPKVPEDVRLYQNWHMCPVYLAALAGDGEYLGNVLKLGFDLDDTDGTYGCTALHHCASRNNLRAVKLLVEAGADVDMKTTKNYPVNTPGSPQTAYGIARTKGYSEIESYLLANGAKKELVPYDQTQKGTKLADLGGQDWSMFEFKKNSKKPKGSEHGEKRVKHEDVGYNEKSLRHKEVGFQNEKADGGIKVLKINYVKLSSLEQNEVVPNRQVLHYEVQSDKRKPSFWERVKKFFKLKDAKFL